MIKSLIKKVIELKLDVTYNGRIIIVNHTKSDPTVAEILLGDFEYLTRHSKGELEDIMIDSFENGPLTAQDIVRGYRCR